MDTVIYQDQHYMVLPEKYLVRIYTFGCATVARILLRDKIFPCENVSR